MSDTAAVLERTPLKSPESVQKPPPKEAPKPIGPKEQQIAQKINTEIKEKANPDKIFKEIAEVPDQEISKTKVSPEVAKKQQIREFTRSTPKGREERQELAEEIKEERRARTEVNKKVEEAKGGVEEASQKAVSKKEELQKAQTEVDRLQAEIDKRNTTLTSQIIDTLTGSIKRKLFERLEQAENKTWELDPEKTASESQLRDLQKEFIQLNFEKSLLNKSKDKLQNFYKDQEWALKKDIEHKKSEQKKSAKEARIRTQEELDKEDPKTRVESVMEDHDVYIVHALAVPMDSVSNYSGRKEFSGKLNYVLENTPHLAASTLKKGDTFRKGNLWSPIGVILNGGRVTYAASHDSQSHVDEATGKRIPRNFIDREMPVADQIPKAIQERDTTEHWSRYTELGIVGSQVAGFFISEDSNNDYGTSRGGPDNRYYTVRDKTIFDTVSPLNMPVYILKDGRAHEAIFDEYTQKFKKGVEVNPSEMRNRTYEGPRLSSNLEQKAA